MINFKNLEEVKKAFPVNSTITIRGKITLITGYYFDRMFWWPVNIVDIDINNFDYRKIYGDAE